MNDTLSPTRIFISGGLGPLESSITINDSTGTSLTPEGEAGAPDSHAAASSTTIPMAIAVTVNLAALDIRG